MNKDIVAEIITCIRNVDTRKKNQTIVQIAYTDITSNIVQILLRKGFIENVRKHQESQKKFLVLTLKTRNQISHKIRSKRISRSSRRIYSDYQQIPNIFGDMGILIISTSRGLMTGKEAILKKLGGEILCFIW
uniref:Small ribosomal subunit protein uS8c n=1 Tax=Didymoplexis pallens TaxID=2848458 RepID=A0A976YHE9_9ASPA|nr:ribosomal protein S8 [Didymoplexis pallens]YP_010471671.1 ribosomal protein S8 [Didymoplexis pallens]UVG41011.1 ribosomal protein S8 [Didymoplexis pallens]UVG41028.1 ribosomal protein S8 [Didymoplexis pallens]